MLAIIDDISPVLGTFMAVVLFGMIFNTAVSMFYAFGARFMKIGTKKFKIFVMITLLVGFALSFRGFKELVSDFYPFVGYAGLFLVAALIFASFKLPKQMEITETRRGQGSFVTEDQGKIAALRDEMKEQLVTTFLQNVAAFGFTTEEIVKSLQERSGRND